MKNCRQTAENEHVMPIMHKSVLKVNLKENLFSLLTHTKEDN